MVEHTDHSCTAALDPPRSPLGHPWGPLPSALGRMDPGNRLIRVLEAELRTTWAQNGSVPHASPEWLVPTESVLHEEGPALSLVTCGNRNRVPHVSESDTVIIVAYL